MAQHIPGSAGHHEPAEIAAQHRCRRPGPTTGPTVSFSGDVTSGTGQRGSGVIPADHAGFVSTPEQATSTVFATASAGGSYRVYSASGKGLVFSTALDDGQGPIEIL